MVQKPGGGSVPRYVAVQWLLNATERSDFLQIIVIPLARDDWKPEIILLSDGERLRQDYHEELHPVLTSPLVDIENPVLAVLLEVLRLEQLAVDGLPTAPQPAPVLNAYTEYIYNEGVRAWKALEEKYWLQFGTGF